MASGVKTIIYPVEDLDRAKAFYGPLLDATPDVDTPHYTQSVVSDDQRRGLDPLAYLRDVLARLPQMTTRDDLDALTPARWQPVA